MKAIEIKPIEKDGKVIGVEIPIIEKELLFEDISKEEMDWYEAMEYAKKKGKALLTKRELFILAYFMDDICKYYPDLRNMWIWSSTEYSKNSAWSLYPHSGLYDTAKYHSTRVVPCADLNTVH